MRRWKMRGLSRTEIQRRGRGGGVAEREGKMTVRSEHPCHAKLLVLKAADIVAKLASTSSQINAAIFFLFP